MYVVVQNGHKYEIPLEVEAAGGAAVEAFVAQQETAGAGVPLTEADGDIFDGWQRYLESATAPEATPDAAPAASQEG